MSANKNSTTSNQNIKNTLPQNIPPPLGAKQWEDLRAANPAEVCRRALVSWNDDGYYCVPFVNKTYRVYPAKELVESDTADPLIHNPEFKLVLLCYLLLAKDITLDCNWVSEKDLRGGSLFFTGPHTLPAILLIKQFGTTPKMILEAGAKIGGEELPGYGDAALVLQVMPRVPCACVVWGGDEEFPARVTFLFDSTADAQLPLDILNALVRYMVKAILKAATI